MSEAWWSPMKTLPGGLNMNTLDRLFKEATGFHKTTCLLASKFTGIKYYDADTHLPFPMLFRGSDGVLFRTVFKDDKADEAWREDANSYFSALIVNGVFSLELHLKHLYLLIEDKHVRGHDLSRLFQGLPESSRTELEAIFRKISESQPLIKMQFDAINEEQGVTRDWSIQMALQESAKAFESWRYCFEGKFKASSFVGYGEAVCAMRIMSTQFKGQHRE